MNKIFINEVKADGYTCQFTFARGKTEQTPMVKLELQCFSQEGINLYFRPCTVDPGRSQVFTSYHDNGQIRRMSTKEYYSFGGTLSRMRSQDRIKIRIGIKTIENNKPSPKTTNVTRYQDHVAYLLLIMDVLLEFYGFNTYENRWLNYLAKQKAKEEAVCNQCKNRTNQSLPRNFKVLRCTTCETLLWNRDTNAARNMWDISSSIWTGDGRPEIFCRRQQQ